jgi:NAD-dependent SIR2 family protein deacetylase
VNRKLYVVLVLGAVVILFTVWFLYPHGVRPPFPKGDYHFMHCPNCGREMPYDEAKVEDPCPRCGPDQPFLIPTKLRVAEMGESVNPWARLIAPLLLEVNVLLVAAWFLSRHPKQGGQREGEYRYMRCEHCRRRLRFAAEKVGQAGQCPRCKTRLLFPEGELAEEEA